MAVSANSVMVFCFLRCFAGVATEAFQLRKRRVGRGRDWFAFDPGQRRLLKTARFLTFQRQEPLGTT
jgi:hypothetical protein